MIPALLLVLALPAVPPPLTTEEKLTAGAPAALGFVLGGLAGATALAFEEAAPYAPFTALGGAALGAAAGGAVGAFLIGREADAPWAAVTAILGVPMGLVAGYGVIYAAVAMSLGLFGIVALASYNSSTPADVTWMGYATLGVITLTVGGFAAAGAGGGALAGLELGQQVRGWMDTQKPKPLRSGPDDPTDRVPEPLRAPASAPLPSSAAPPPDAPPPPIDDDTDAIDL